MKVWATLGFFDGCDGRIVELDATDGSVREVLCHTPPPPLRVEGKGFTGACRLGDTLLVCGAAAVYRFDRSLTPRGALASPDFNDLHGITAYGDRLYVINTGLDAIDVFDLHGNFVGSHALDMAWINARRLRGDCPERERHAQLHQLGFSDAPEPDADFEAAALDDRYYHGRNLPFARRRQRDYVHPNHALVHDGRLWITSLARRALIDATTFRPIAHIDEPPHDGRVYDGALWLTRVDGIIERRALTDPATVLDHIDATAAGEMSGWCRGLHLDGTHLWVGFTAVHHPPRYPWHRAEPDRTTTGVICLDRRTREPRARFDLTVPGRHAKVFALLEAG